MYPNVSNNRQEKKLIILCSSLSTTLSQAITSLFVYEEFWKHCWKRNQHFLLFKRCFQPLPTKKWIYTLSLSQTSPGFHVSPVQAFWKHCGKRRNCLLRAISPFPPVFSTLSKNSLPFSSKLKLLSANSCSSKSLKFIVWERVNHFLSSLKCFQFGTD